MPLTVEVEILQNKGYPFTILDVQTKRDDVIRCRLVEQCTTSSNRCVLQVENIQTKSGRYADTITVHTDNAGKVQFSYPCCRDNPLRPETDLISRPTGRRR